MMQALQELELEVEHCPEIFAAVERLTSYGFEVIVADWADGIEASFLLKTSRDLKANSMACTVAIVENQESAAAAREIGVDVVLRKPIAPDAAKHTLLTSDAFLQHMRVWLPRVLSKRRQYSTSQPTAGGDAAMSSSPPQAPDSQDYSAAARFESYTDQPSSILTLFRSTFAQAGRTGKWRSGQKWLFFIAMAVALFSLAYVCSEPLQAGVTNSSIADIYGHALQTTQRWLHPSRADARASANSLTQSASSDSLPEPPPLRIRVFPAHATPQSTSRPRLSLANEQVPSFLKSSSEAVPASMVSSRIPESLKQPLRTNQVVGVAPKVASSLLGPLEPVFLPESIAQQLLLEKVQPSYPDQALRAGVKGSVILQACIGKDGRVVDLKLVRGYFVLGQAAYKAVKQWRFKPYLFNGRAVEAQTFLTIDFQLP